MNTNISCAAEEAYEYELLSKININTFYEKNIDINIKQMKNINNNFIKIVIFFQILMNEISNFIEYFCTINNGVYIIFFNDIVSYINNNINTITNKKLNIFEVFLIKKVFIKGIEKIYNNKKNTNVVKNS